MPIAIRIMYTLLTTFWLVFLINLLIPLDSTVGFWIDWLGTALLVIHLLELALVGSKLKAIGRSALPDVAMVLLFGVLYWKPLLPKS